MNFPSYWNIIVPHQPHEATVSLLLKKKIHRCFFCFVVFLAARHWSVPLRCIGTLHMAGWQSVAQNVFLFVSRHVFERHHWRRDSWNILPRPAAEVDQRSLQPKYNTSVSRTKRHLYSNHLHRHYKNLVTKSTLFLFWGFFSCMNKAQHCEFIAHQQLFKCWQSSCSIQEKNKLT